MEKKNYRDNTSVDLTDNQALIIDFLRQEGGATFQQVGARLGLKPGGAVHAVISPLLTSERIACRLKDGVPWYTIGKSESS